MHIKTIIAAAIAATFIAGAAAAQTYTFQMPVPGLRGPGGAGSGNGSSGAEPAPCVTHTVTYTGKAGAAEGDDGELIAVPATVVGTCLHVDYIVVGAGSQAPAGGSATPSDRVTGTFNIPQGMPIVMLAPANATSGAPSCASSGCWVYSSRLYVGGTESASANGAFVSAPSYTPPTVCTTGCSGQYVQFGGVSGATPGYVTLTFRP